MSRLTRVLEAAERITGVAFRPLEDVTRLEETSVEYRGKMRELQDLAYTVMDYIGGQPEDLKAMERRKLAQKARIVHQQDPQYGGTVNLMNEFTLGRGIPKPTANDEAVQAEIDDFWEDPDNKRVLTTHQAQVRLNTELSLCSNIFPLVYDGGDDGIVKLGWEPHDNVEEAVRDPDAHLRVLFYLCKSHKRRWDPVRHCYRVTPERSHVRYYEEFSGLREAQSDVDAGADRTEPIPGIPEALIGNGRIVHVAINRTMGQAFGVPEIARTIRFLTAYNDVLRARVDMAKAAASIIMRRKLKGATAREMANSALRAGGGSAVAPDLLARAPRPGSMVQDLEGAVEHEAFNLNSGSQGAMQDVQIIGGQVSAGTGWPANYRGEPGGMALSMATSLELKVLKMIEARQQVLEDLIRLIVDHKIELAIKVGRLSKWRPMTTEERKRELHKQQEEEATQAELPPLPPEVDTALATVTTREEEDTPPEGMVERDLSYQVSMPSPLRRAMGDVINACANIAKTFDPNNTNLDLSKLLLAISLGEMEVEDPGAAVERVFPDGYIDPAVMASAVPFTEVPAPEGPDGELHPDPGNPYGAPLAAQPPEAVMQSSLAALASELRVLRLHSRDGELMPVHLQEAILRRTGGELASAAARARGRRQEASGRGERAVHEAEDLLVDAVARALEMAA